VNASEWTAVRIRSIGDRQALIGALFELGAEGVQELECELVTHVRSLDRVRALDVLSAADKGAAAEFTATPDIDWASEWRARLTAHRVGALVVTPPWLAHEFHDGERVVVEPGMAFGTGDHETTRGVLRLLAGVLRMGDVVADIGAGSAVLGIAAAKLGARHSFCIEIDSDAIDNAVRNVAINGLSDRVSVLEGDAAFLLPLVGPVGVVLANIQSSVLVDLLATIGAALTPDGAAILAGILLDERAAVEMALDGQGWRVAATDTEGTWWSAVITRA
jgi:ribosomal protein L11 methyltransferase